MAEPALAHGWRGAPPAAAAPLIPPLGRESVEIGVKYQSYLERQEREVERVQAAALAPIPPGLDYASLPCLSSEEVEKLTLARPATLREAGAIEGITPSAMLYLCQAIGKQQGKRARAQADDRVH